MSANNSIVIVSDNNELVSLLTSKLVLLRDLDNILDTPKIGAFEYIQGVLPNIILIHCLNNDTISLNLLKALKSNVLLKNTPAIAIIQGCDQDFIVSAYDEGLSDFLPYPVNDAELVMRVIWAIQKNENLRSREVLKDFLAKIGVLDEASGFYSSKYSKALLEQKIESDLRYKNPASLLLIEADLNSKNMPSNLKLANSIAKSIRHSDICAIVNDNRYFVYLPKTRLNGAFTVYDKIKADLMGDFTISASVCEISEESFENIEVALLKSLKRALNSGNTIIIADKDDKAPLPSWLNRIKNDKVENKNFKLFKNTYDRKVEQIVLPSFKRLASEILNKHPQIETFEKQEDNEVFFSLKYNLCESSLKIIYPGFSKVNVDVLNTDGTNRDFERLNIDIKEITPESFSRLCEALRAEFEKLIS